MTDRETTRPMGWQALEIRPAPDREPFADWYEAWRAQTTILRVSQQAERVRMRRGIRLMSGLIAAWSLVLGGAAAIAIWIVL